MQAVLLRQEAFGGLVFVPEDAVHMELDQDAFRFLHDYLFNNRAPENPDETALLSKVLKEAGRESLQPARVVKYPSEAGTYPFPVYNAPTLADFQITTHCPLGCPHCYASANTDKDWVHLDDVERVFDQLEKNGVTQVALGGGEPLSHPGLIPILEMCHQRGLVPNLTTNGLYFDPDRLAAMKKFCGAVALSLEGVGDHYVRTRRTGFDFFLDRLAMLLSHGIPTVLQITLCQENFPQLDDMVDFCLQHPRLYGVIFLAYKEVGRGRHFDHVLAGLDPSLVHSKLGQAFLRLSHQTRVGYDCCLTPGLVGLEADLGFAPSDQLEGCSALRSSMGILPSLDVVPCTFTPDMVMGNLGQESLARIWRKRKTHAFRNRISRRIQDPAQCGPCPSRLDCLGGCPVFNLVRCGRGGSTS